MAMFCLGTHVQKHTTKSHAELYQFCCFLYIVFLLNPLTLLDYFLWGYMMSLMYKIQVESQNDLLAQVMAAAGVGLSGIGDHVYQNMICRYCVCVEVAGRKCTQKENNIQ